MDRKTATLAVLFADIANSTVLYDVLGDKFAQNLISLCLSALEKVTLEHQGTVIKTIGDEVMCVFPHADLAVEAGKAMHQTVELITIADRIDLEPPNLYIGIHFGQVIMENRDVFGDTVNIAARVTQLAKQRQILITQQVFDTLSPELKTFTKCVDTTTIKGKSGKFNIYETIWEIQDVTIAFQGPIDTLMIKEPELNLELTFQGQRVNINQNCLKVNLGRQPHNDIVVESKAISRSHARIELKRDKFILTDQSTNGTYILNKEKKIAQIKQDETQLLGSGTISLGQEAGIDSPDAIHFKIKS